MEKNRSQRIYKIIMLIFLTMFVTALITAIVMYNYLGNNSDKIKYVTLNGNQSDISTSLSKFKTIIDQYYLGEVNEEKLKEGAIKGYIDAIDDPYTEYYTKEEMESYKEETLGNFTGIGIYMVKDEEKDLIKVLAPIKDTPAYKAGIQPGDIIYKIDGVEYKSNQMNEAANKIKGENGTKVKLEVIRGEEKLELELTRENIKINHVEAKTMNNNTGYIKFTSFDEGCADEFKQKFEEINNKNLKSLIIDLRNNGGGLVEEALKIANYMTEKDSTLLITVDKNGKEEIEKAKDGKTIDMPIVVLINGNTASASEILAGALRDNNVAKIVGTKSYGKGVIQELLSLTDGTGLKITTNEYYTPNRSKINKVGIEPDEKVEVSEKIENSLQIDEKDDIQLQKAIEVVNK